MPSMFFVCCSKRGYRNDKPFSKFMFLVIVSKHGNILSSFVEECSSLKTFNPTNWIGPFDVIVASRVQFVKVSYKKKIKNYNFIILLCY